MCINIKLVMRTIYFNNIYDIEDTSRKKKYLSLLILSLKNDLNKWEQKIITKMDGNDTIMYSSPIYGSSRFIIYYVGKLTFATISHKSPPIKDAYYEFITDSYVKELGECITNLTQTIFTPEVYEIQKQLNDGGRKEKLEHFELLQTKNVVDETYQDWLNSESEVSAKLIAKLIYSYKSKNDIYNLWIEKFKDIELVNNELNKLIS